MEREDLQEIIELNGDAGIFLPGNSPHTQEFIGIHKDEQRGTWFVSGALVGDWVLHQYRDVEDLLDVLYQHYRESDVEGY